MEYYGTLRPFFEDYFKCIQKQLFSKVNDIMHKIIYSMWYQFYFLRRCRNQNRKKSSQMLKLMVFSGDICFSFLKISNMPTLLAAQKINNIKNH